MKLFALLLTLLLAVFFFFITREKALPTHAEVVTPLKNTVQTQSIAPVHKVTTNEKTLSLPKENTTDTPSLQTSKKELPLPVPSTQKEQEPQQPNEKSTHSSVPAPLLVKSEEISKRKSLQETRTKEREQREASRLKEHEADAIARTKADKERALKRENIEAARSAHREQVAKERQEEAKQLTAQRYKREKIESDLAKQVAHERAQQRVQREQARETTRQQRAYEAAKKRQEREERTKKRAAQQKAFVASKKLLEKKRVKEESQAQAALHISQEAENVNLKELHIQKKSIEHTLKEQIADEKSQSKERLLKTFSHTKVTFTNNEAQLTKQSKTVLNETARLMKANPHFHYNIQGHTDSTGNPSYNLKLSSERAKSVKAYLVQQGVENTQLTFKGFGSSNPIASNNTKEGRLKNRRVVFEIIK